MTAVVMMFVICVAISLTTGMAVFLWGTADRNHL